MGLLVLRDAVHDIPRNLDFLRSLAIAG